MRQTFILRNHNNSVDDVTANNKIKKKNTNNIFYFFIGWDAIETSDYIERIVSEDNVYINETEVLNKLGYERAKE